MLSVEVGEDYAKAIDKAIAASGLYSSRSEFLKDSIRKNLADTIELSWSLEKFREGAKKLGAKARKRGYAGGLLSKEEKEKIALDFIKKHGL